MDEIARLIEQAIRAEENILLQDAVREVKYWMEYPFRYIN